MYPQQPPNDGGFQPYPQGWQPPPPKTGFQWMPDGSSERWKYAAVAFVANAVLSGLGVALMHSPAGAAFGAPFGLAFWVYVIAAVSAPRKQSTPNYDYGFGVPPAQGGYQPYPQPQQPPFQYPQQPPTDGGGYYTGR